MMLGWLTPGQAQGELVEGFTEPYRQIDVSAGSESGLIMSVKVKEGQQVRVGELIAELDTDVLVATLNVARERSILTGRLDGARAELELRRHRLTKLRELLQQGHATEGELERAQTDVAVAKANLVLAVEERRLAALESKRIEPQIERRHVRSPFDGIVTQVHREIGEAVLINDPRLVTLVQLNPLRVKFSLSVQQAGQIAEKQVLGLLLTDLDQPLEGTVEVIAPVLDAKSGTVQVTCVIDNRNNQYRSGMRCVLKLSDAKSPLSVSSERLQSRR